MLIASIALVGCAGDVLVSLPFTGPFELGLLWVERPGGPLELYELPPSGAAWVGEGLPKDAAFRVEAYSFGEAFEPVPASLAAIPPPAPLEAFAWDAAPGVEPAWQALSREPAALRVHRRRPPRQEPPLDVCLASSATIALGGPVVDAALHESDAERALYVVRRRERGFELRRHVLGSGLAPADPIGETLFVAPDAQHLGRPAVSSDGRELFVVLRGAGEAQDRLVRLSRAGTGPLALDPDPIVVGPPGGALRDPALFDHDRRLLYVWVAGASEDKLLEESGGALRVLSRPTRATPFDDPVELALPAPVLAAALACGGDCLAVDGGARRFFAIEPASLGLVAGPTYEAWGVGRRLSLTADGRRGLAAIGGDLHVLDACPARPPPPASDFCLSEEARPVEGWPAGAVAQSSAVQLEGAERVLYAAIYADVDLRYARFPMSSPTVVRPEDRVDLLAVPPPALFLYQPAMSPDGLELVFSATAERSGELRQLFHACRGQVDQPFGVPTPLYASDPSVGSWGFEPQFLGDGRLAFVKLLSPGVQGLAVYGQGVLDAEPLGASVDALSVGCGHVFAFRYSPTQTVSIHGFDPDARPMLGLPRSVVLPAFADHVYVDPECRGLYFASGHVDHTLPHHLGWVPRVPCP